MAKAKEIIVKESLQELKSILKKSSSKIRPRIQMLIAIKRSPKALTKYELAGEVGVNHNSITSWRRIYEKGGIDSITHHNQGGKRREVIDAHTRKAIEKRLNSPKEGFSSYKELQQWIDEYYIKGIRYITVVKYVQREFGAKLKMARKSHIGKDVKAVEGFKKNDISVSKTY